MSAASGFNFRDHFQEGQFCMFSVAEGAEFVTCMITRVDHATKTCCLFSHPHVEPHQIYNDVPFDKIFEVPAGACVGLTKFTWPDIQNYNAFLKSDFDIKTPLVIEFERDLKRRRSKQAD